MNPQEQIAQRLIRKGEELANAPYQPHSFTDIPEANAILNDLQKYPHAFVLGCIMDKVVQHKRAWAIPYYVSKEIGGFEFDKLLGIDENRLIDIFKTNGLHFHYEKMAKEFFSAVQHIQTKYGGDASRIWKDGNPDAKTIIERFMEFHGVADKIATMATNILYRTFKISMRGLEALDISVDTHVARVFARLGLVPKDAKKGDIIARAKELHPAYPGIFDRPVWKIGEQWCRENNPNCAECEMNDICPKIL